jgi:hypothetical protein
LIGSVVSDPQGDDQNCYGALPTFNYAIEGGDNFTCKLGWPPRDFNSSVAAVALGPLANHGGPTQTMMPSASSVLVTNAAPDNLGTGITTDQRGVPRTGSFTLGAVQYVAPGGSGVPHGFKGFFAPVNNKTWNTVREAARVPLQWRLRDGSNGRVITDPAALIGQTHTAIDCQTGADLPGAFTRPAVGSPVTWRKGLQRFLYKWTVPNAGGSCVRLDLTFRDGITRSARFRIKERPDK